MKLIDSIDKRLKEVCTEVEDFDNKDYYLNIIEEMKDECLNQYAYACAAPQFGIMKRFILMITAEEMKVNKAEELDELDINYSITPYFNPKIISMEGKQYFYEACMSVGDVIGKVARPYSIEIEAQDIDGNYIYKKVEGFEAIVMCHEIDHLDGIEFTDKAIDIIYDADLEKRVEVRNKFPHEIVTKDGEFNQDDIDHKFKTLLYSKKNF
ncbi:MAG: peptide deformylase [Lactobacillales bacterium]|nr:peptide deformylase [Lactobacillales bacterium]